MKLHPITWLFGISVVGIVVWLSTSNEYSLEELTSKVVDSEFTKQNSEMADRDNAAEEVRAVATKITNLEQIIETQKTENQFERDRLKDELEAKFEEILNAIDTDNQQQPGEGTINIVNDLESRIEQLEIEDEMTEATLDLAGISDSGFIWHYSEDSTLPDEVEPGFFDGGLPDDTGLVNLDDTADPLRLTPNHPYYTIPPTTTLLNATAFTALVGRIPVGGRLQDPWRFKIIVGPDNLAANGHRIPQLAGMIWAGTARGDLALSCVSGSLDTATFIFVDGTVHTSRNRSDPANLNSGLGWISDEFGNPCIEGELKSNALQYLTQATLVNTAMATAEALSNAQTESSYDSRSGETNTSVVGNVDKFVAGYAVKESLNETSKWLADRQLSSFDAIYVAAGQSVAIHVEESILIDRKPDGRKVRYLDENVPTANARTGWFD